MPDFPCSYYAITYIFYNKESANMIEKKLK